MVIKPGKYIAVQNGKYAMLICEAINHGNKEDKDSDAASHKHCI
jgi:hypothetical protein